MKIFLTIFFIIIYAPVYSFSQCPSESVFGGEVLREISFTVEKNETFALKINAGAKNSSWLEKNSEAAVLTVFVDGKYNQDAFLFAGEKSFEYKFLLGDFNAGEHKVSLVFNKNLSASLIKEVNIKSAEVFALAGQSELELKALQNSPVIYARAETIGKFSDIPLVLYYEILPQTDNSSIIRYTAIFTNEDGGTQSAALLARWGRLTDIEWVYEIRVSSEGKILEEIYQGINHQTKKFLGQRIFGSHPLLLNASVNNNFNDQGCSPARFFPFPVSVNLKNGSRETVMDQLSWTYRIMAQEIIREGRVDPDNLGENKIDDPRNYYFVEIESTPENAAVSVKIENERETSYSDWQDSRLRVERKGFFRIAVRKPVNLKSLFPKSISLVCSAKSNEKNGVCRNTRGIKIGRLDKNFNLIEKRINANAENINAGAEIEVKIK